MTCENTVLSFLVAWKFFLEFSITAVECFRITSNVVHSFAKNLQHISLNRPYCQRSDELNKVKKREKYWWHNKFVDVVKHRTRKVKRNTLFSIENWCVYKTEETHTQCNTYAASQITLKHPHQKKRKCSHFQIPTSAAYARRTKSSQCERAYHKRKTKKTLFLVGVFAL